jgi:hypothetical protein
MRMLSVVIATNESERALVPTLAALVPGATAGLVREVIIADPGSRDATAEVADIAGCRMLVSAAPLAERLAQAVEIARGPWLLFLEAGAVPQAGWVEETNRFIEEASLAGQAAAVAAVFRAISPSVIRAAPLREAIALMLQAAGLSRGASHGLLIGKDLYRRIGGQGAAEQEADAIRAIVQRLGRRRIVTLRCGAVGA